MPAKPTTNTIACGSCGHANGPDMSFCLACGKVLSARMAALRKARGVKKRECASCKRSDELNNRYCIFCGAEIQKRHGGQNNADALEKFTMEISGVQDRRAIDDAQREVGKKAPAPAVQAQKSKGLGVVPTYAVYMLIAASCALAAALLTPVNLPRAIFALTSPVKQGLIMYTRQPYVTVVLESSDKKRYVMGSTGTSGSLAVTDIAPGDYLARFSKEGCETVLQAVDVQADKLNLLGFDSPIELPPSFGEESK